MSTALAHLEKASHVVESEIPLLYIINTHISTYLNLSNTAQYRSISFLYDGYTIYSKLRQQRVY
jgi:hypothetical protein